MKAPPPVLAYDWSGFYIGGVIGGAWERTDTSDPGLGVLGTLLNVPVVQTTTGSGFIGGVEGGDRYQFGKLVVGWEADMTWGECQRHQHDDLRPDRRSSGAVQPDALDHHQHQLDRTRRSARWASPMTAG